VSKTKLDHNDPRTLEGYPTIVKKETHWAVQGWTESTFPPDGMYAGGSCSYPHYTTREEVEALAHQHNAFLEIESWDEQ